MTGADVRVTVWSNPRCSKSRGALELLAERGVEVDEVRYLDTPPPRAEIERVLGSLGYADPRDGLVRTGEAAYRDLGLAAASREEVVAALTEHPELIERPVVVAGDRAVVARPPERLLELL